MSNILIVEDEIITARGLKSIIESIDSTLDIDITAYANKALSLAKKTITMYFY